MKIQESAENYLETILVLKERKGLVRSIDIANELEFSKPSVSIAVKRRAKSVRRSRRRQTASVRPSGDRPGSTAAR